MYMCLTHFFRQQVDVLFVAALRSIVQFDQSQGLGRKEPGLGYHDNSGAERTRSHPHTYIHTQSADKTLAKNTRNFVKYLSTAVKVLITS